MFKTCFKVKFICVEVSIYFYFLDCLKQTFEPVSPRPLLQVNLPVSRLFSRVSQIVSTPALSYYGNTIRHRKAYTHTEMHTCTYIWTYSSHTQRHTHLRPCHFPPLNLSLCCFFCLGCPSCPHLANF